MLFTISPGETSIASIIDFPKISSITLVRYVEEEMSSGRLALSFRKLRKYSLADVG